MLLNFKFIYIYITLFLGSYQNQNARSLTTKVSFHMTFFAGIKYLYYTINFSNFKLK